MTILLVEDDLAEAKLTQEALQETGLAYQLFTVGNGEDAIDFLRRSAAYSNAPTPDVVLLDLNLPRKHGREVLREIKSDPVLHRIPIIVVSNSRSREDVDEVYHLNGNGYLTKPGDLLEFFAMIRSLVDFWLCKARLPTLACSS
jgi:two-component system, chemotaxis family, response regulator Rcp1